MNSLQPNDIEVAYIGNGKLQFSRGDKLLCICDAPAPDGKSVVDVRKVAAAAWNAAYSEGMELGRRLLQEELKDLLDIK